MAIVGAGSTGVTTAYELAREGFRVVVIDKRGVGQGMTAYSLGIVRSYYTNKDVAELARYSHEFFLNFERYFGTGVFTRTGLVVISNDAEAMEGAYGMLRGLNARVRLLQPRDIKELLGEAVVSDDEVGIWEEDAGYVDTGLYVNTVMRRAQELGVRLLIDEASPIIEGNEVVGLRTRESGVVRAGEYVWAVNVWSNKYAPWLGLGIKNVIERVVRARVSRALPIVFDYVHNYYVRPEGSEQALMGMLYPPEDTWEDPDTFPTLTPPDIQYALKVMESAARRFPFMENAQFLGGWQGLYDVTRDWMPIIDRPMRNLIICVGLSGHGFKLAPAFARIITELIKYGREKTLPNPFRANRRELTGIKGQRAAF